MIKISRTRAE